MNQNLKILSEKLTKYAQAPIKTELTGDKEARPVPAAGPVTYVSDKGPAVNFGDLSDLSKLLKPQQGFYTRDQFWNYLNRVEEAAIKEISSGKTKDDRNNAYDLLRQIRQLKTDLVNLSQQEKYKSYSLVDTDKTSLKHKFPEDLRKEYAEKINNAKDPKEKNRLRHELALKLEKSYGKGGVDKDVDTELQPVLAYGLKYFTLNDEIVKDLENSKKMQEVINKPDAAFKLNDFMNAARKPATFWDPLVEQYITASDFQLSGPDLLAKYREFLFALRGLVGQIYQMSGARTELERDYKYWLGSIQSLDDYLRSR